VRGGAGGGRRIPFADAGRAKTRPAKKIEVHGASAPPSPAPRTPVVASAPCSCCNCHPSLARSFASTFASRFFFHSPWRARRRRLAGPAIVPLKLFPRRLDRGAAHISRTLSSPNTLQDPFPPVRPDFLSRRLLGNLSRHCLFSSSPPPPPPFSNTATHARTAGTSSRPVGGAGEDGERRGRRRCSSGRGAVAPARARRGQPDRVLRCVLCRVDGRGCCASNRAGSARPPVAAGEKSDRERRKRARARLACVGGVRALSFVARRSKKAHALAQKRRQQRHHADISIGGQPAGRLRMELWKDLVPKTGEGGARARGDFFFSCFLLVASSKGRKPVPSPPPSQKHTHTQPRTSGSFARASSCARASPPDTRCGEIPRPRLRLFTRGAAPRLQEGESERNAAAAAAPPPPPHPPPPHQ